MKSTPSKFSGGNVGIMGFFGSIECSKNPSSAINFYGRIITDDICKVGGSHRCFP